MSSQQMPCTMLTVSQDHISTAWHQDAVCARRLFESALSAGGIVKVLRIPNGKAISNARIKTKGDVASKALGKWQHVISGLSLLMPGRQLTYQQCFGWCVARREAVSGTEQQPTHLAQSCCFKGLTMQALTQQCSCKVRWHKSSVALCTAFTLYADCNCHCTSCDLSLSAEGKASEAGPC